MLYFDWMKGVKAQTFVYVYVNGQICRADQCTHREGSEPQYTTVKTCVQRLEMKLIYCCQHKTQRIWYVFHTTSGVAQILLFNRIST